MGIKERWFRFKPLPSDISERIERLKPLFEREGVRLAYLFGSLSSGGQGQDVDIAVLPGDGDFSQLRQEIGEVLGTERLDLLNLKGASPLLRFEVIRSGRLIYRRDDQTENDFEMEVLRQYRDTAYLRARQATLLQRRTKQWLSRRK